MSKSLASLVDPGEPPPAVAQQADFMKRVLDGEADTATPPTDPVATPAKVPSHAPAAVPRHKITLEFLAAGKSLVKLQFNALDVDVGETYISLGVDPALVIEPSDIIDANLTHAGKTYSVSWVGGCAKLRLAGMPVSIISFLRKTNDDDKTRNGAAGSDTEPD